MPWVATTQRALVSFGGTGSWWWIRPEPASMADFHSVPFPSGVNTVDAKPSFAPWISDGQSRLCTVGGHTDNLVFTEHYKLCRQGILPPSCEIISGSGSGAKAGLTTSGTGITGTCIGYLTWYDALHDRRSPLSNPSPTITLTNQGRIWSNLPTDPRDTSVTHIELWVSMNGATPAFVVRRDLGCTSVTENVATLSLGEAFDQDFERFPRCRYNVQWHDRQVMAGDDRHPERIYFSILNQVERYGGLYLRTRMGDRVRALYVVRDQLHVATARRTYIVTGWTEDDIEMTILEPAIGCVSHHGVIPFHRYALVPTMIGPFLASGTALHFLGKDYERHWRKEYETYRDNYEKSWGVDDPDENVAKLFVGAHSMGGAANAYWVNDYSSVAEELGGGFAPPSLSFDLRGRVDTAGAVLSVPTSGRGLLYTGSEDGYIRQENYAADDGDDNDTNLKTMVVWDAARAWDEPAGDDEDGWVYPSFWSHVQADNNTYVVDWFAGDDTAWQLINPSQTETVAAGYEEDALLRPLNPKSVHVSEPHVVGRTLSTRWTIASPKSDVRWLGYGGTREPGGNARGPVQNEEL